MLEHVKEYLRITGDFDDNLVSLLINSAKDYLKNAGVEEQDTDLYKLAITMLVTHWYENRNQQTDSRTQTVMDLGIQTIILQLKAGGSNGESS